jgi:putative ABC transport system permease protein
MIGIQELLTSVEVGLILGIVAIGVFTTFKTINFADMTCDGSFVSGAAVTAVLIKDGTNPYLAILASMIAGGLAGVLTGILNIRYKIADLLAGIIVSYMLYSVNLMVMGNAPSVTFVDHTTIFSSSALPAIVVVTLLVAAVTCMMFSSFGLKLRAVGYNRQFATTHGIDVDKMTVLGLAMSNAMIAAGGSIFSQFQGFCDVAGGFGMLVMGLASIIIGTNILPFKREPLLILSCVAGSIMYRIFINVALHSDALGIKTQSLNLVTGIIMIAIMMMRGGVKSNAKVK